jgi:hypothetical protein
VVSDPDLYSSFRFSIQFQESNDFENHNFSLLTFDLFGHLVILDNSQSLNSLIKFTSGDKPPIFPSHSYPFPLSETRHSGLLYFLSSFPSSTVLKYLL